MAGPVPHLPSSPEGDAFHAAVTPEVLVGICQDITEEDDRYARHEVTRTRAAYDWDTLDGITYNVSLTGWHCYKDDEEDLSLYAEPTYLGQAYELGLEISYELEDETVPEELHTYLGRQKQALPENIHDITVTYGIELVVPASRRLTWREVRFYDIEYVTETIDGSVADKVITDNGEFVIDDTEIGMTVSRLGHMRVAINLDSHDAISVSDEQLPSMDETTDEMYARIVEQLIESCQSDPQGKWLNTAVAITEMIKFRAEGSFDLARAFPPDVLALINEA